MRKKVFIILATIAIVLLVAFGLVYYALEHETYNVYPCSADGELVIDSLRKQYEVGSWSWYAKNFCDDCIEYDPATVDCSLMICEVGMREPDIDFQTDSMIHQLMRLFWSFPENEDVDSLYLTIENNHKRISTKLKKSDQDKSINNMVYDTLDTFSDFILTHRLEGSESGGGGDYEKYKINRREVIVSSAIDLFDFREVADSFYRSELSNCKKDNIATLYVTIETEHPKGQFISEKTCEYRYESLRRASQ